MHAFFKLLKKLFDLINLHRLESISLRKVHGVAKVLGAAVSLSGALVYAFVKGPPLKFMMNWNPSSHGQGHQISYHRKEWIKGSLMMLSANTAWSLWLTLQVIIHFHCQQ